MANEEVAQALSIIQLAHQVGASQDAQKTAAQLLDSYKHGDAGRAWQLASCLVGTPHLEAQHFGMKILQHVARHRWRDLGQEAQQALAGDAMAGFERVAQTDVPYSIRSMTAVLVAECVRQGGPAMWEAVLQKVQAAAAVPPSNPGPAGAAVLVLHYVHDEVTGPHASLPADLKRALLSALTASLDVVLPMLLSVMESHFVEATRTGSARNEAVVCEALRCAEQVATWCPVAKMHQSRLVDAFAVLGRQGPGETRLAAVECLRQLAERRNRDEDQGPFSEAMGQVGVALMGCASPLLDSAAGQASMAPHADNEDFGKRLCDSMQLFGSAHLDCLPSRDTRMIFLQQMILFAQHSSITLSAFTLPFWLSLLRELKGDFFAAPARRAEACPDECLHALLRICFDKLAAVVEAHAKDPEGSTLAEFDSDVEWHVFFSQYKSQLIHIVKQAATLPAISQPLLDAAIDRFQAALARTTAAATSGAPLPEHTLEAEVATLDAVLSAVPRELQRSDLPSGARLDGLLEQVLGAPKPSVPTVCVTLAQSVQALVKHLAGSSAAIGACFKYLLDLTLSLPSEGASVPPSSPSPGWRAAFVARNRIVTVLLTVATASPESSLPFLQDLLLQTERMWDSGKLTHGERNVLAEAILSVCEGAEGARSMEKMVMERVLEPMRVSWSQPSFQASMASNAAFVSTYATPSVAPTGEVTVAGREARWQLFHEIQLIERVLRRIKPPGGTGGPLGAIWEDPGEGPLPETVFDPWVEWTMERALVVLRRVQALSTPEGRAALGPAAQALEPSPAERMVLLGQQPSQVATMTSRGGVVPESGGSVGGPTIPALRNWIRGLREGVYQIISVGADHVPRLFELQRLAGTISEVLVEGLAAGDDRHLRLALRHVTMSILRRCPRRLRGLWLAPILGSLMPRMEAHLKQLWAELLPNLDGANAPSTKEDAAQASDEVVKERIIRDLTKDYAGLLQAVTGAGQVPGDPLSEGQTVMEFLSQAHPEAFGSHIRSCMLLLTVPDTDSASRALLCCRVIVSITARQKQRGEFADMVGGGMLRHCLEALTLPSNQTCHGELLSIIREILVGVGPYTDTHIATLSLIPTLGPSGAQQLLSELSTLSKEVEQKALVKKALGSVGRDVMQAMVDTTLAERKSVAPGSLRPRVPKVPVFDDPVAEMAAAEAYSLLFDS